MTSTGIETKDIQLLDSTKCVKNLMSVADFSQCCVPLWKEELLVSHLSR